MNSDRDRLGGLALGEQLGFDVAPEVVAFDVLRLGSGVVSRGSRLEHERGGDLPRDRVADGGDEDGVIRALVEHAQPCGALPCPIYAPPGAASAIAVLETSSGRMAACAARVRDHVHIDTDPAGAR